MPERPTKGSLLVIFLTIFIDLLGFGIVLPLLPIYANQFALDESGFQLGVLMASFSVMQFFFAPMWGRFSDRIGRRPVLMIGLSGSVAFYLLFAWATLWESFNLLLISRTGAGIAGATISTAQAYIADSTTLEKRPKGMALVGMAFGLGFTLGPLIGLLAVLGGDGSPGAWPGYIAAALSAAALLIAWCVLPESLQPDSQSASRRIFDTAAFGKALATPSIGALLLTLFICVFTFASFETTLSLLIKGERIDGSPFQFSFTQVFLTFSFIGFMMALIQGGVVRRLAGRISEGVLASTGAILQVMGFILIVVAIRISCVILLISALGVVVSGFGFIIPSLNSLISRRSAPRDQGGILGVGQSVNSLARIFGSGFGIPLLKASIGLPFVVGGGLMTVALFLVVWAYRSGRDFSIEDSESV